MNQNTQKKDNTVSAISSSQGIGRETYWDYTGKEALSRVGKNPQLKGTIHELAFRDKQNLKSVLSFGNEKTRLTHSTTAVRDDVVTTNSRGYITRRYQLKDVTSESGSYNLNKQIDSGKYRRSNIIGTVETAEKIEEVQSSGISSTSTTRAADNTGVNLPDKNILSNNFKDIGKQAKNSAIFAGVISAGMEAKTSYQDYKNGNISKLQYTGRVLKSGAGSAVTSGCKTTVALGFKEGSKALGEKLCKEGLKKFAGSNTATSIAFSAVDQITDTFRLARGKISGREYGARTTQNVSTTGGAMAGAAAGAAIGSVVPVIGTAIGATVGGILGSIGGSCGGNFLGRKIFRR